MKKIFLLLKEEKLHQEISKILKIIDCEAEFASGEIDDNLLNLKNFCPDIVLIDFNIDNLEFIIRQVRDIVKLYNSQIILLSENCENLEVLQLADGIIKLPLDEKMVTYLIESHYKTKQSLDRLFENNRELSKSLYQLNVLYNTSSQFAGTLNTNKLYDIMLEAMDKTLSYDLSCLLIFNSSNQLIFNLNTIHSASEALINALKIRCVLNYKTILDDKINPTYNLANVEVAHKIKQARSNKIFGLEIFNFDTLFAPIKVGDDFFGIIELFRQKEFSAEDVTCFQAIAHQVALPLRSAKLYEEISVTNKKLEKLERLKSEFVSIVSHELRTPLTPINNSLEIVLSEQTGILTPEAKNFISMAKRNIQRLSGIIEDLLDLSRIQTGKLDFKFKEVDIVPSLELLKETFEQVSQEKNTNIDLKIEDELPLIYADLRRVEQILSNLVSNALKFTSNNGNIKVSAKIIDSNQIDKTKLINPIHEILGKYIQISVCDDGIGINKEDIPKIFDKFSQIESSLNRNKGGVGLGLTITKQLIDSHLGAIWVESEYKKGATFNVLLPLIDKFKSFVMDLSQSLILSKDVGLIKIKSNNLENLIQTLKNNKLLNLTNKSREIFYNNQYFVYIPNVEITSFEALFNTIEEFCERNKEQNCATILKSAHSYKNGLDSLKLIDVLNK